MFFLRMNDMIDGKNGSELDKRTKVLIVFVVVCDRETHL